MTFLRSALAVAAVLALTSLAPPGHATVELRMTDGVTTVTILDGGGGDANPLPNIVTYIGPVGTFLVNTTQGSSTSPNSQTPNDLDLFSFHVVSPGAGTLTVRLSDDGFTPPQTGWHFGIGGTNTAGGTLTAQAFGGTNNLKFDTSNPIISPLLFTSPPVSFSADVFGTSVPASDPFALTIVTSLTYGASGGTTSYDAQLDPVPEPASVALLGGLLLVTAGAVRRKMRRS